MIIFLFSCGNKCVSPPTRCFVVYYPDSNDTITITQCGVKLMSNKGTNKLFKSGGITGEGEFISYLQTTAIIREIQCKN